MKPERHFVTVPADRYLKGYAKLRLRDDVARAYLAALDTAHQYGAIITSSGGRRSPFAIVTANRSRTSMHYLGRAFDLYLYSGMVDPRTDPYVVTRNGRRRWRVFARCQDGQEMCLAGWTYRVPLLGARAMPMPVSGRFIDLTGLFERHGFRSIPPRKSFFKGDRRRDGAAEWWHFQYTRKLEQHRTTFGDELLQVYQPWRVKTSPLWKYRNFAFNGVSFG